MKNDREIERIRLRCVCGEDGCWLWAGSVNGNGLPTLCRVVDGEKKNMSGRRWVYLAAGGTLRTGDMVGTTCEVPNCLNPDHLRRTTRSVVQRRNNQRDPGLALRRGMAIKAAWNRKGGGHKLTAEQAEWARVCGAPSDVVAQTLGVSIAMVNYIRAGKCWKPTNNPFAGLMS